MESFLDYVIYSGNEGKTIITVSSIMIVILAYVVALVILKFVYMFVIKRIQESNVPKIKLVFNFFKYFIICIIFIVSMDAVGINMTTFLVGSSAILVGLGFGLQRLFQDIISGVFILLDKSVYVGDIIEIENKKGIVFEINLRAARIKTLDNKVLIIPNHKFLDNVIFNWSQNGVLIRESITVGVSYGSDVELVRKTLIDVASAHHQVLKENKPSVVFEDFADSSLNFRLNFFTHEGFFAESIKSDLRFEICRLFRERHIQIPFPQRDLHIISKSTDPNAKIL